VAVGHGMAFLNEHQEGGLECILGIMLVGQDGSTDAEHHWTVPLNQCCEGRFIATGDESVDQLTVG